MNSSDLHKQGYSSMSNRRLTTSDKNLALFLHLK